MPLITENTENHQDEIEEAGIPELSGAANESDAGAVDASETTEVTPKHSPKSLVDLILDLVAQDPVVSMDLVQNNILENSHITEVLIKNSPFIELIPAEIKCNIIASLSVKDWKSLFNVNHEWRDVVVTAAKNFLNEIARDKSTIIQVGQFDEMLNNLMKNVDNYTKESGRGRGEQVRMLKQLEKDINNLEGSLEKLIHFKKRLHEVKCDIENEYNNGYTMRLFGPKNSRLYQIVSFSIEECKQIAESPWFKKVQFCVDIWPDHSISKYYFDTYLERHPQKKSAEEQTRDISQLKEQLEGLTLALSM